eukprot:TRINITY_DN2555_c0_g1_i10.p2 TRINITY_DN2555_c0_g1~~TRINITY_DN2555_c0_g1_i10.p2  ORF type:complete len:112 (+),score=16.21 TRINITY_DN2555_c0_g1_i10:489-824(+)
MNNAYPIARSQNIRRDEISINSQLMNAKEMEIWNFRQSIILQYPKSLSYKTVIPAAAEAAASESVAVTQSPTTKRLIKIGLRRTAFFANAYASKHESPKHQITCKPIEAIR